MRPENFMMYVRFFLALTNKKRRKTLLHDMKTIKGQSLQEQRAILLTLLQFD